MSLPIKTPSIYLPTTVPPPPYFQPFPYMFHGTYSFSVVLAETLLVPSDGSVVLAETSNGRACAAGALLPYMFQGTENLRVFHAAFFLVRSYE